MIGHFPGGPATDGDLCECEPLIHWSQGDTTIEIDANRLCFDSGREVPIILATESRRGLALATPIVDALKDELRARKIDVMIIDPFVRCRLVSERPNKRRRRSVGRHRRFCNAAITRSEAISESGDLTSIPSSNDVPGPGRVIIPPRPFGSVTGFSVGQLDVGLNSQHLQNMFKIFF